MRSYSYPSFPLHYIYLSQIKWIFSYVCSFELAQSGNGTSTRKHTFWCWFFFFCYFVSTHDIPFKNVFALVSLFIFSLSFFLFFLLLFLVWFCIAWLSGVLFRYVDALFVWWNKKNKYVGCVILRKMNSLWFTFRACLIAYIYLNCEPF